MGLSTEQASIETNVALRNYLELRLMNLSSERQLKYNEGAAKIAQISSQMSYETQALRDQISDDASSEEYRQMMANVESVENEYQVIIDNIRNQMEQAEEEFDLQQEQIETRLEVIRSQEDQWKEARDNTVERTCGYFNE